ncbi:serine protein kinase RIO [Candidatus Woesearchaeota archaeon]|nr:serine protein kinase RIO [Candidatus Woesearchaeota archaeon]
MFKLESEGYFDELKSPVSIGKESNVFTAVKKDGSYVIIKIYRVNNADFKRMYKYIGPDPRFKGLSNQRRKVISAWAQREYRNLLVASQAGARVPTPYAVKDNVLVMELIGRCNEPAPRLKNKPPKNIKKFSKELIKNLNLFYKNGFIHGDLSEFNILNHNDIPYIIDLSHGVKLDYPNVNELLDRDIKNLEKYFNKFGLKLDFDNIIKS